MILFYGDTHGDLRHVLPTVKEAKPAVIIFLGGIFRDSVWYPRYTVDVEPTFMSYEEYVAESLKAERWKLYREQAKSSMNANDWKQNQESIANGSIPDLPMPELAGKALTHKSSIFYEDYTELYGQKADILVTHEAPSCHRHGFIAIDSLAQSMKVKTTFHGHHHDCLDYSEHEAKLGFKPHGVGLRGVTDMYGGMIRAGQLDEQRMNRGSK
jgi:hypothetical protein